MFRRPPGADAQAFQLNLHAGNPVEQQQHVIAVMAVIRVDPQLVHHLKAVLAPVFDGDQGVIRAC